MTTEPMTSAASPPAGGTTDQRKRILLALGLVLMIVASVITQVFYIPRIEKALRGADVLLTENAGDEPRHVLGATLKRDLLDAPILKVEIPRNEAEFLALTPPSTHAAWKGVLLVDLILIVGYILMFLGIALGSREDPTLWEQVGFCGIATGVADCIENGTIWSLLGTTTAELRFGQLSTWIALLTIVGALKWLIFFLACRAVCIELETLKNWRWIAVWLRATSTAGSWAALLALIGLPSRPILTLMAYGSALLITVVAVKRLRGDAPGERVVQELSAPEELSETPRVARA